jgi:hypothetical protein
MSCKDAAQQIVTDREDETYGWRLEELLLRLTRKNRDSNSYRLLSRWCRRILSELVIIQFVRSPYMAFAAFDCNGIAEMLNALDSGTHMASGKSAS